MKNFSLLVLILQISHGLSVPVLGLSQEEQDEVGALIDNRYALDPHNMEISSIAKNVELISTAVMGTAELVMQIQSDLKLLRKELMMGKMNMRFEGRQNPMSLEERIQHHQVLASKLEKIFELGNDTAVELVKVEIKKMIQMNFVRALSTLLVHGPMSMQEKRPEIMRLMKAVLNDEYDFMPVVEKLPVILRETENNHFARILQEIRHTHRTARQDDEDEDEDDTTTTPKTVISQTQQVQETLIYVPRPKPQQQQQQQGQTVVTQNGQIVGLVNNQGGGNLGGNLPQSQQQQILSQQSQGFVGQQQQPETSAPIKIILQQPQAPQQATQATTPRPNRFGQVIDAIGKVDPQQVTGIINNLPDLFEGIDGIVGGFEGIIP